MIRTLEIGDRVTIWDFSSVTHGDGRHFEDDDYDLFHDGLKLVVIAIGQQNKYDSYFKTYHQDLVIANPQTKAEYRANSSHVKIV